jgi:hypothetical protein
MRKLVTITRSRSALRSSGEAIPARPPAARSSWAAMGQPSGVPCPHAGDELGGAEDRGAAATATSPAWSASSSDAPNPEPGPRAASGHGAVISPPRGS